MVNVQVVFESRIQSYTCKIFNHNVSSCFTDVVLDQDVTATNSSVEIAVKGWLKHAKARHEREV